MQVGILGPLEVSAEGRAVELDAPKERAVLEALALRAGEVVTTDQLVEALWDEDPPPSAAKSLQSHLSRLRRALPTGVIATEGTGYRLTLAPEAVDAHRFEGLVTAGRQALAGGDPTRAAGLLDEGLVLWRGTPLADLADGPLRSAQTARLTELRETAAELRMDAHLDRGEHESVIGDLEALVAEEPLRERRWAQLMLALHRSGRRADALAAYQRLRRHLRDELGIDPSHELRELDARILQEDPALDLPPPPPPCTLPTPLTTFVGRERLVRDLRKLLHTDRLVTVVGPGGVGKSRLAVEVARADTAGWPDGVWWMDLAHVEQRRAPATTIARALGVAVPPGGNPAEALRWFLAPRRLLLVIDNAEAFAGELGRALGEVLAPARDVTALVTSRIPLGIPGERVVAVPPLEVPEPEAVDPLSTEAVRLFLDRLADHDAASVGADDLTAVAALCRLVDGLPLGIELVAGRVGSLPPADVLAELGERSRLLAQRGPGRDPRHAGLEAVLTSTVELLGSETREGFARLSLFPRDFDLDAAAAVAGRATTTDFDRLLASGLVVAVEPSPTERRYRLFDTTRAYAATLVDEDDAAAAAQRHAEHYRELAREAARFMETPAETTWLERLHREDANLRQALAWFDRHDPPGALPLANAVGRAWFVWGDLEEAVRLLDRLLAAAPASGADHAEVAWAHVRSGWPRFLTGDVAGGLSELQTATAMFRELDDPAGLNRALAGRAHMTLLATGDADAAFDWYRQAVVAARRAGIPTLLAWTLAEAAQALYLADRADPEVDAMVDEAEAVFEAADDHVGLGHVAMDRMFAAYAREDLDALDAACERGIRHSRAAGYSVYEQVLLVARGVARLHQRRYDEGARLLQHGVDLAAETSNLLQLGIALYAVAVDAALTGDPVAAARLWGAAGTLAPEWPLFARRYGELTAPARDSLGPEWAEESRRGAALPREEILALARDVTSATG